MPVLSRQKTCLLLGITLLLGSALLGLYTAYQQDWLRLNHPTRREFDLWGLDVSHHQGRIDWTKIDADEFRFVFIKATEGGDFRDPRFVENWKGAQDAGLVRGAYHFFTLCRPAVDQFKNLLAVAPPEEGTLPPAIDLEFGGNCSKRPGIEVLQGEVLFLIQEIERTYAQKPIIYVTRQFYQAYALADLQHPRIWMRNRWQRPLRPKNWLFWQFSDRGNVKGIQTPVDLNVFRSTETHFLSILQ